MARDERYPDTFTLEELAAVLGLDTWQAIEDRDPDAWLDEACSAVRSAKADRGREREMAEACGHPDPGPLTEDEEDYIRSEAETAARDEDYARWASAVEQVAERAFDEHRMRLEPLKRGAERPWSRRFRVRPIVSWTDAAEGILDTINGMGPFYFESVDEMAESIPCTVRRAVLCHLGWMASRPKVYGDRTYRDDYDRRAAR